MTGLNKISEPIMMEKGRKTMNHTKSFRVEYQGITGIKYSEFICKGFMQSTNTFLIFGL